MAFKETDAKSLAKTINDKLKKRVTDTSVESLNSEDVWGDILTEIYKEIKKELKAVFSSGEAVPKDGGKALKTTWIGKINE